MRTKRTLVPGAGDLDRLQLREPESELMIQICRAVLCFELRLTIAINSHFSLEWKLKINPLSTLLSEPHLLYKAQEVFPVDISQTGAAPLLVQQRCNRSISDRRKRIQGAINVRHSRHSSA